MDDEKIPTNWEEYDKEVRKIEAEGCDRSDAQGVIDARLERAGVDVRTWPPYKNL